MKIPFEMKKFKPIAEHTIRIVELQNQHVSINSQIIQFLHSFIIGHHFGSKFVELRVFFQNIETYIFQIIQFGHGEMIQKTETLKEHIQNAFRSLNHFNILNQIFEGIENIVTNDIIFYQQGNIINGQNERLALQEKFNSFQDFRFIQNQVMIQTQMFGITFHWISFVTTKIIIKTKFILMDSRNLVFYFLWNQQQIKEFQQQNQLNKSKRGQQPLKLFFYDANNKKIEVFLIPLIEIVGISYDEHNNLQFQQDYFLVMRFELYQKLDIWSHQHHITVLEYKECTKLITQLNKILFQKYLELKSAALEYQTKRRLQNQQKLSFLLRILNYLYQVYQSM
ncbi:unnamed protein product [Paramecium pentaurelia]|uniref:Uncharacterized protein n=1 Tax=Paramecium pentaurelia TaxID=43138 RepID=A0A8S1SFN2_9CILI|nr:unnamed protein product [Paramecium pentaurelia]